MAYKFCREHPAGISKINAVLMQFLIQFTDYTYFLVCELWVPPAVRSLLLYKLIYRDRSYYATFYGLLHQADIPAWHSMSSRKGLILPRVFTSGEILTDKVIRWQVQTKYKLSHSTWNASFVQPTQEKLFVRQEQTLYTHSSLFIVQRHQHILPGGTVMLSIARGREFV